MVYDYCDEILQGTGIPSPYPIYPKYRGQPELNYHPAARGDEEFNPQLFEGMGLAHDSPMLQPTQFVELQYASNQPEPHRIEGANLDHGRVLTNPGRYVAPLLCTGVWGDSFGRPHEVADSCPAPQVVRSFGQFTASPHDMVHTTPKQLLDYDYAAVSQQDIADKARLALRKAIYGR